MARAPSPSQLTQQATKSIKVPSEVGFTAQPKRQVEVSRAAGHRPDGSQKGRPRRHYQHSDQVRAIRDRLRARLRFTCLCDDPLGQSKTFAFGQDLPPETIELRAP